MKIISDNMQPLWQEHIDIGTAETPVPETPENVSLFSHCRDGLFMAARYCPVPGKRVMIPAYTCVTVYNPFAELGWEVAFYPVGTDLRINAQAFRETLRTFRPSAVVAHPYYGTDLNDEELGLLAEAKAQGALIIEDLTQSTFSTQNADVVDVFVGSLYKWFPITDGGFLRSDVLPPRLDAGLPEDHLYHQRKLYAQTVFRYYLENGDPMLKKAARRLEKDAAAAHPYVVPYRMSDFSRRVYAACDKAANNARRMENCRYLFERLKDCKKCRLIWNDFSEVKTGPLWFPLYVADRVYMRDVVEKQCGFTAPRLWGNEHPEAHLDAATDFITSHIVCPTCGQNYTTEDMERIAVAIETADMPDIR